jgi:hypothetical protein
MKHGLLKEKEKIMKACTNREKNIETQAEVHAERKNC